MVKKFKKFDDDELVDFLDQAKPLEWQSALLASNLKPHNLSWEDTVDYFKKLEVCNENDHELSKSENLRRQRKIASMNKQKRIPIAITMEAITSASALISGVATAIWTTITPTRVL